MTRHRALFLLRVTSGGVFVAFGAGKFVNHASELASFRAYGLPVPEAFVVAIGVIELVGRMLLIAEVLIRPAALILAGDMSEPQRRIVAVWAADCAERVLGLFEAEAPGDRRPRAAIVRTRAFGRGELSVAEEIRRRFAAGSVRGGASPVAAAAARAAGQAAAIPHMGAHALGAAAYAAKAVGLAAPDRSGAVSEEIAWQLGNLSAEARVALRQLPLVGENRSGPLGPGLLASGVLGRIIRDLQGALAKADR